MNPIHHLLLRAKVQPNKIALLDLVDSIDYKQLFILVKKFARMIELSGIKAGDVVVTCFPSKLDWIFTNALFHEACITCSNHGYTPINPSIKVDWVISDNRIENIPDDKFILIDQSWIQSAQEVTVVNPVKSYNNDNDLCRLVLTSGTTGEAKAVGLSLNTLRRRLNSVNSYWCGPGSQINMMSLATVGGFYSAMYSIMVGETFYCVNLANDVLNVAQRCKVDSVTGSPIQLSLLVNAAELLQVKPPTFKEIRSGGGTLPRSLLHKLAALFEADVFNVYGSTEVGGVYFDLLNKQDSSDCAGYILNSAQVEVVDENHMPLPLGVDGFIRIKTDGMVHEYFQNPEATARSFREGWFYPGDKGRLMRDGMLVLSGRDSELINLGGVKINPDTIDQFMVDYSGIEDAAACGLENKSGIDVLVAAIVVAEGFDIKAPHIELLKKFGTSRSPSIFIRVKEIPRNHMGKVARAQLKKGLANILVQQVGQEII